MKAGYRKFYKYFSILVFMGCGYLMLNFWEEGKGQISSYNMQDKALMILWFMIYTFGTAAGIINTLTSIYIYEWGMQISFLKYKKKIEWEEFSVIRRYHNHFSSICQNKRCRSVLGNVSSLYQFCNIR